jgi:hypothetical protein
VSRYPHGTKRDHEKFCRTERWDLVRDATGRPVGHHLTFELSLPDGRILRTRISHPVDNTTYGDRLWPHILKHQLEVTATQFWSCLRDGELPDRGGRAAPPPASTLSLYLLTELVERVGMSEDAASRLSMQQATAAIAEYWRTHPE